MQSLTDLFTDAQLPAQGQLKAKLTLLPASTTFFLHYWAQEPSPAPLTPVPPFVQAVAHIKVLIIQIFSAQYLKSIDTIQLLICTAGLGLDCCSVLFPGFPKYCFASLPPNYFLVGGSL